MHRLRYAYYNHPQDAMREVDPRSGLPRAPPHLLEQLYAEQRRGPLVLRDFLAHVALSDK